MTNVIRITRQLVESSDSMIKGPFFMMAQWLSQKKMGSLIRKRWISGIKQFCWVKWSPKEIGTTPQVGPFPWARGGFFFFNQLKESKNQLTLKIPTSIYNSLFCTSSTSMITVACKRLELNGDNTQLFLSIVVSCN